MTSGSRNEDPGCQVGEQSSAVASNVEPEGPGSKPQPIFTPAGYVRVQRLWGRGVNLDLFLPQQVTPCGGTGKVRRHGDDVHGSDVDVDVGVTNVEVQFGPLRYNN